MSDERGDSKLVVRAETLVAQAERREPDYEALAMRIEGALATAGKSDDSLLLPPLPESIDDGQLSPAEATETKADVAASAVPAEQPALEREETSLADLARAALARREAKDKVSIAKESLAIATQQRTPAAPKAAKAAPTIETEDTRERKRSTIPPARRSRPAFDTRGPWIGVGVAAIGLAAGFGLYLAGNRKTEIVQIPVSENMPRTAPQATTQATAQGAPTTKALNADALPVEQSAPATPVLTPEALARESAPPKTAASVADARPAAPVERAGALPSTATAATTGAGAAKPEKIVLEEEHAAHDAAAARPTKPAPTPGMKPAELNANGGIADRPSTGAAQAAVGAVLGAARSCIAGQPQGSSATLVFGSSGEVSNVNVSGPAEGTPAAACIQSALKKARVQPFAAASFSLGVTIRPP